MGLCGKVRSFCVKMGRGEDIVGGEMGVVKVGLVWIMLGLV